MLADKNGPIPAGTDTAGPGGFSLAKRWRYLAYFLGVPLVFALYASLNNWEMLQTTGPAASFLFYLGHSILPWLITCTATWLSMRILARWKPPWLLLLLLGHTFSSLLVIPYSGWLGGLYESIWPDLHFSADSESLLLTTMWMYLRAGIIWFGVNFIFDQFIGLPLYRYEIPRGYDAIAGNSPDNSCDSGWGSYPPGFIARLPAALEPEEVLAIKAEQHYIRVYSPAKEYMILYRFSDAIRELDQTFGTQVHRSYWVNTNAIQSVHARAKDFYVHISNDTDIPVSTPYQGIIRELARSQRIPLRG